MITIIIVLTCWALAAACNAVMDTLAFKFKTSIFKDLDATYWNPACSWRNKYKNKVPFNGSAFFGSTTFLRFLTDGWHLFQFLSNSFLALSVLVVILHYTSLDWWKILAIFLSIKVTWQIVFEIFYTLILRRYR